MQAQQREVIFYETARGRRPVEEWLQHLKDHKSRSRILRRILQAGQGNLGDYKVIERSLIELRMFFKSSPGFRLYIGLDGDKLLVLLLGGDKASQDGDIQKAKEYWNDYLEN